MANNNISFFVSSTFKDMQGERDSLHRTIIPKIREFSANYGRNVDFIDLRWGISTDDLNSDEGTNKILKVCLDEIEQCSPYQIVILGERYGWMPSPDILQNTVNQKNFELNSTNISVTELEILYGLWVNKNNLNRCIFCMRESENIDSLDDNTRSLYVSDNDDDINRMNFLKTRIRNTPGIHIIDYKVDHSNNLNKYKDFENELSSKIIDILTEEWGGLRHLSWIEKQSELESMLNEELLSRFSSRESILSNIKNLIFNYSYDFLILKGNDGCGLSSIMAKTGKLLAENGYKTRNIYCGKGFCSDTTQLLKLLIAECSDQLENDEFTKVLPESNDLDFWKDKWNQVAANYNGDKLCILIDGIHHLSPDEGLLHSYYLPTSNCSKNLSFIVSINNKMTIDPIAVEKLNRRCFHVFVDNCSMEEMREIISSRMHSAHKQIGNKLMDALLQHPLINNMICMELILQDILNLDFADFEKINELEKSIGGNEAISTYLIKLVKQHPNDETGLINFWMERSLLNLANHNNEEYQYLYYLLACMILSSDGLSSTELSDMAEYIKNSGRASGKNWHEWWSEARFSAFRQYFDHILIKSSEGRYKFAHEQIRSGLFANKYMSSLVAGPMIYFNSLPDDSDLKQDNLLASYLIYLTNKINLRDISESSNTYFWKHLIDAFILANSEHSLDRNIGTKRINRMLNGMRNVFLYAEGDKKVTSLFHLLSNRAESGVSTLDHSIHGFISRFSNKLNNQSIYEKSILLALYIGIFKGYEKWEGESGSPKVSKYNDQLGVYDKWTEVERRLLTKMYADAIDYYHEVSCYFNTPEKVVKTSWDWEKLSNKAQLYINSFQVNSIFRGEFCNKIVLIFADNNLIDNYQYSFKLIKESFGFNKNILIRASKKDEKLNKIVIKSYLNSVLNTVESLIKLGNCVKGKEKDTIVQGLYDEAYFQCKKGLRKLIQKKLIQELHDLPPVLRARFMRIRNYTEFLYESKDKQQHIDNMWELYLSGIEDKTFRYDHEIREELSKIAITLMEYLLDGFIPSHYLDKDRSNYIGKLQYFENNYMSIKGYANNYSENVYMIYLLRAIHLLKIEDREALVRECSDSIDVLEYYLNIWQSNVNDYVIKCKSLLEWHKQLLRNLN